MQLFFIAAILLFILKIFYGNPDTIPTRLLFDFIIGVAIFFLVLALIRFENSRSSLPLSLVLNVGILLAIMFFIIMFSDYLLTSIFDTVNLKLNNPGLVYNIVSIIYVLILVSIISFFLVILRHFFILNQAKNSRIYFNTMLVFFILASVSINFLNDDGFEFLITTFFIVAVLLMIFNSLQNLVDCFFNKERKNLFITAFLFNHNSVYRKHYQ